MRTFLLAIVSVVALGMLATAGVAQASVVEEPDYDVVSKHRGFELRHYGPTIEARAPLNHYGQLSDGFRVVAGYIFGGNSHEDGQSEKIAMTAPVGFSSEVDAAWISFVMPADYEMAELPEPTDPRVRLVEVPARTVATLRFSGVARTKVVEARIGELRAALESEGIEVTGEPIVAQYNPPWIPGPLRRNEVMLPVAVR